MLPPAQASGSALLPSAATGYFTTLADIRELSVLPVVGAVDTVDRMDQRLRFPVNLDPVSSTVCRSGKIGVETSGMRRPVSDGML
jgi:hypothetical protein